MYVCMYVCMYVQKRKDALVLEIKADEGEYRNMKSKSSSNKTTKEIEQLLSQIELIKGKQARLEEVNKQLKDVDKNISKTDRGSEKRCRQNNVNTNNGVGDVDKNNNRAGGKVKYDFQKDTVLERSEAVEREMKKLKENLRKDG